MGKTKAQQKASSLPKSASGPSDEEFCEKWEKIEAKLKNWIVERLPAIMQLKSQELIIPGVNRSTTSTKFCEAVSERVKFDFEKCRNIETVS